ncbi:uncharacterized protein shld1 [Rhincodon typus]|uniref:uncharacterized protein shld1 n=1 Tax=Rhincodon typus TaxID=259920 RepID=UPI00202F458C|nr:uncharacterized protein shld1 [Rhincodon typus]
MASISLIKIMSTNEVLSSNLSESNSVLELPTTYSLPHIGEQLMFEDIVRKHSDSVVITSASATPITSIDFQHVQKAFSF